MRTLKFKFDENIFKNIKDVNFIYYLGLLWADGHNREYATIIAMKREDFNDIKHIFDNIDGIEFSYKDRYENIEKWKPQKCIRVYRKSFCDFLRKNDYNEKSHKSADKILSLIPKNKRKYFFRGIIDGDGCFYHKGSAKQFSISSSVNQDWSYVTELFDSLGIEKYSIRRVKRIKQSWSLIRISNIHDMKKLCDYIYDDVTDNIFLKRKYEKYIGILNSSDLNIKRNRYNIDVNVMVSLDEEGKSLKEISDYFNCTIDSIYRRLLDYKKENGTHIPKLYNIDIDEILLLKKEGKSIKELSQHYNCSERTIYRRLDSFKSK